MLATCVGFFDSCAFLEDVLANLHKFLDGTVPPNITSATHSCVLELKQDTSGTGNCTTVAGTEADDYFR